MNEIMHGNKSIENSHCKLDVALGDGLVSKSLNVKDLSVKTPQNIIEDIDRISKIVVDKISELTLELTRTYFLEAEKRVSESARIAEQQKGKLTLELNEARGDIAILEQKLSASISENIRLSQNLESEGVLYLQRCAEINELKEKIQMNEKKSKMRDGEINCNLSRLEKEIDCLKFSLHQEFEVTSTKFKMLEDHLFNTIAIEKELSTSKENFLISYKEFASCLKSLIVNNHEKTVLLNRDLTSLRHFITSREEYENEKNVDEANFSITDVSSQSDSLQENKELHNFNLLNSSEVIKNAGLYAQKYETLNLNG